MFNESKITIRTWEDGQSVSIWHLAPGLWTFCHVHHKSGSHA